MQLSKREAARVFRKLHVEPKASRHHVAGVVKLDGELVLPVYYSHGRGDIPGRVVELFRKSLCITVDEFRRLVQCSMSREEWSDIVRSRLSAR